MPSNALHRWNTEARENLDQILTAHAAIGGNQRGRRYALEQVNHAYTVLLASQFQGFCRDLHSEAADHIASAVGSAQVRDLARRNFIFGRKLDRGNAHASSLGSDFNRLGMELIPAVRDADRHSGSRLAKLELLNRWRNAIAHQDFANTLHLDLGDGRLTLRLADVRAWRNACERLAGTIDEVVRAYLETVVGHSPW